ncbi:MAG: 6-pyruvoyl trahydropterin synthase family protein [Thermoanaerobaculia bacterium]
MIRLSREIHFNASRRLWRPEWSQTRNRSVFGDESPHGYGHNYRLEVEIAGEIDPEKAMVVNLTDLDRILKEEVDRPLDHKNLNLDVPAFATTIPTFENLARWIWERVSERITRERWPCRISRLRLSPTPDVSVEIEE